MKMFRFTVAAACMALCGSAVAAFEGTDYVVLEKPLENATGTIVKVWSYDCSHCFRFDSSVDPRVMPDVTEKTGLKFVPMHLETKGKYGRAASIFFAMCMLRDDAKGVPHDSDDSLYKQAKEAVFWEYHRAKQRWEEGEAAFVATMCEATGLKASDYEAAKKDAKVLALADGWKKGYDVAKVQGIPAYVVNGRYLIKTTNIGGVSGMKTLIEELNALPK